jgi:ADP-ribose pyrophosphatase YjhB (NUDIX family)
MKYSGSLVKKEREQIFKLFLEKDKLKFSEIEKEIKIRSNMVSYHLEKMLEEGILEKKGQYYYLTKTSERYIPIFSHLVGNDLSPLPVILVAVMKKDKILMIKRNKRPYKNYWSMIGGKMMFDETFESSSIRQVEEKAGIKSAFVSINSVLHERVEEEGIVKYSFILFFTKVAVKYEKFKDTSQGELKWFSVKQLENEKVIPSDYWLLKNKLSSKIDVKSADMNESEGNLSGFKIRKKK